MLARDRVAHASLVHTGSTTPCMSSGRSAPAAEEGSAWHSHDPPSPRPLLGMPSPPDAPGFDKDSQANPPSPSRHKPGTRACLPVVRLAPRPLPPACGRQASPLSFQRRGQPPLCRRGGQARERGVHAVGGLHLLPAGRSGAGRESHAPRVQPCPGLPRQPVPEQQQVQASRQRGIQRARRASAGRAVAPGSLALGLGRLLHRDGRPQPAPRLAAADGHGAIRAHHARQQHASAQSGLAAGV